MSDDIKEIQARLTLRKQAVEGYEQAQQACGKLAPFNVFAYGYCHGAIGATNAIHDALEEGLDKPTYDLIMDLIPSIFPNPKRESPKRGGFCE